jgi:hypothetical protein
MFRPFSIQIDKSVLSCIVAMLIGAIDVLSGEQHAYFLMRELSGGTSKFIMWWACLWINIFSQIISSFFLLLDFNTLAELLISCPKFQKCNAMADFAVWFNLRFLKCTFVLVSKFLFICPVYTFYSYFLNSRFFQWSFLLFLRKIKKDTIYKKFTYHPWTNNRFQKIFKDFDIILVPINKCNIKNLIKANYILD